MLSELKHLLFVLQCVCVCVCFGLELFSFFPQIYNSEAGWCEEGVGERGLPGAEGTSGGISSSG